MQVNRDVSHLQILVAIGSKLNDSENFEEVLQEITDVAAELTQSHCNGSFGSVMGLLVQAQPSC